MPFIPCIVALAGNFGVCSTVAYCIAYAGDRDVLLFIAFGTARILSRRYSTYELVHMMLRLLVLMLKLRMQALR